MAHSCVCRFACDINRFIRNELPCGGHEGIGLCSHLVTQTSV
jgi:hypothetical protein